LENKNTEINKLLIKLSRESVRNYKLVDFWEADTTAIGIQIENTLIYVSALIMTELINTMLLLENTTQEK